MKETKQQGRTVFYRNTLRWVLLVFSAIIFTNSIFSGLISGDSSLKGLIQSTPDNFTWLLLLGINWVVWKSELTGSIILAVFAVVAGLLNNAFTDNPSLLYKIIIPLLIISILLIHYHFLIDRKKMNKEEKKRK